ncbi:dienelactone hydrolase family protein, partial [Escherichia coli]|uniref:dienelactone hydrolase family protein n=1 Tax=Escherichia coli TaxID=562 RepID=UPI004068B603
MGGSLTFVTATRLALGAAVTFYGGGIMSSRMGQPPLIELAPSLQTPWLGLFGEDDAGIPVAEIDQLTAVIAPLAPDTDVIIYPGAGHGFH